MAAPEHGPMLAKYRTNLQDGSIQQLPDHLESIEDPLHNTKVYSMTSTVKRLWDRLFPRDALPREMAGVILFFSGIEGNTTLTPFIEVPSSRAEDPYRGMHTDPSLQILNLDLIMPNIPFRLFQAYLWRQHSKRYGLIADAHFGLPTTQQVQELKSATLSDGVMFDHDIVVLGRPEDGGMAIRDGGVTAIAASGKEH